METPKTVAALKRHLDLGAKIECTLFEGQIPPERMQGVGVIVKKQTNGVSIQRNGRNSFFNFPKASEYIPMQDGYFTVTDVAERQYRIFDRESDEKKEIKRCASFGCGRLVDEKNDYCEFH